MTFPYIAYLLLFLLKSLIPFGGKDPEATIPLHAFCYFQRNYLGSLKNNK